MVEVTPSGVIVATCDECRVSWLPTIQELQKLPRRCTGKQKHYKWNASGLVVRTREVTPAPICISSIEEAYAHFTQTGERGHHT